MNAPLPHNETDRLLALRSYHVLDTAPERTYDDITHLAAYICGTPIATITLIDAERQWFKSKVGVTHSENPREHAFCAHTILRTETFVVEDASQDTRFADNPLVTAPQGIRFYAGAPLLDPQGHALGSVCVIDNQPRKLLPEQRDSLERLARLVIVNLEMRRASDHLAGALQNVKELSGMLPYCAYCKQIRNDAGYWQKLESFLHDNTDALLTHGICPKCAREHFPDVTS